MAQRRKPNQRASGKREGGSDSRGLGPWGGKAKSLSSAYSEFVTDTRTEVVSGGASEGAGKVRLSEEEAVPSRGWEGCHTSACCLAHIRILLHSLPKLFNIFQLN